jgi:hypothetical protein
VPTNTSDRGGGRGAGAQKTLAALHLSSLTPALPRYFQQLLKLTAGRVLNLTDYVIVDSDVVFYRDVTFIAHPARSGVDECGAAYHYAYSRENHKTYSTTNHLLTGGIVKWDNDISGIAHHMAIKKTVSESLLDFITKKWNASHFWEAVVDHAVVGRLSFSEYELYLIYAWAEYRDTVVLRQVRRSPGKPSPPRPY